MHLARQAQPVHLAQLAQPVHLSGVSKTIHFDRRHVLTIFSRLKFGALVTSQTDVFLFDQFNVVLLLIC